MFITNGLARLLGATCEARSAAHVVRSASGFGRYKEIFKIGRAHV